MRAYGEACAAAEREELSHLVEKALALCDSVAEQQAYTDDSWKPGAEEIRAAIRARGET